MGTAVTMTVARLTTKAPPPESVRANSASPPQKTRAAYPANRSTSRRAIILANSAPIADPGAVQRTPLPVTIQTQRKKWNTIS